MPEPSDDTGLIVAITRIETKVDIALTDHGSKLEDHEKRLRAVESKPTLAPWKLWTGALGAIAATGTIVGIIQSI